MLPISWLKRMLLALVLGIALTFGVAWGIALRESSVWPTNQWIIAAPFEAQVGWPMPALKYALQMPVFTNPNAPLIMLPGTATVTPPPPPPPPNRTPALVLTTHRGRFILPLALAWPGAGVNLVCLTAAALVAILAVDLVRFRVLRLKRRRWSLAREWRTHAIVGFVIGICVTLGVAWWLTINRMPASPTAAEVIGVARDPVGGASFMLQEATGFGWRFVEGINAEGRAPPSAKTVERPWSMPRDLRPEEHWVEIRVGWPFRAVRSGFRGAWPPREGEGAVWLPYMHLSTVSGDHLLPVVPMWSGLLTSAAIYGAGYAMIAASVCALIRRRRQGKCPNCLYSLRGLPAGTACPECGAAAEPA